MRAVPLRPYHGRLRRELRPGQPHARAGSTAARLANHPGAYAPIRLLLCDIDPAQVWDKSGASAHWRGRPEGAPFFAVFNTEITHESRIFQPTAGRVTPGMVTLPAYLPDEPDIRAEFASYYNLMERMDGEIARRLSELASDGLSNDTIVFYYSDNGGVLPRSKRYCYDEGLRCALIVRVPPRWAHLAPGAPGTQIGSPASLIDLPPTVLALAGEAPPRQMQGRSLFGARSARSQPYAFSMRNRMDERYDMVRTVTDGRHRYIRNYMPHRAHGQHQAFAWLARGYQAWESAHIAGRLAGSTDAFWKPRAFEEFYDLKADPDQVDNRVADDRYAGTVAALSEALDAHMLAIHDNGFIPEGAPQEGFEESRRPGVYPLARIMALAALAARRDPSNLATLELCLEDSNEVIRYWAALGVALLGAAAGPAEAAVRRRLSVEGSPQVRVVLAEAMAACGKATEMAPFLAAILDSSPSPAVRLQALNALTYLGPAAAEALHSINRAASSENEYLRNAGRYLNLVLTGGYKPAAPIFDLQALLRSTAAQTSR